MSLAASWRAAIAAQPSLSASGGDIHLSAAVCVSTQAMPEGLNGFDALIIPGFFATDSVTLFGQLHSEWLPITARLKELRGNPIVAASCYGTFVLAESGLLDGRRATTSWWFQRDFVRRYPLVCLDAEKALVDDGTVITAGAMTAHAELTLQVLRRLHGAGLARNVGSIMLVGDGKSSQLPFMMAERSFPDPVVQQAADWISANLTRPFSGASVAAACHVSYRTLHRRFTAAAGIAPQAYLQTLRVEHAKTLLENNRMSLEGIVAEIGYADGPSFRRLFLRMTGLSPAQYRRRFRQEG